MKKSGGSSKIRLTKMPVKIPQTKASTESGPMGVPTEVSSAKAPTKVPRQGWKTVFYVLGLSAWVITVIIGAQFMLAVPASMIFPENIVSTTLFNALFSLATYGLALFVLLWLTPRIVEKFQEKILKNKPYPVKIDRIRMGLFGLPTWTDIGLAPIGYIASILIAAGLTLLFKLFPWFDSGQAQELGYTAYMQGWERGVAFIALVVIAPIAEELVFRGFLYGKLRIKIPKWLAILITSLIFGLIHLQWNVGLTVFAMSLVTCTMREITGTIYAGMLVHMINNGVAFFLVYVIGMV